MKTKLLISSSVPPTHRVTSNSLLPSLVFETDAAVSTGNPSSLVSNPSNPELIRTDLSSGGWKPTGGFVVEGAVFMEAHDVAVTSSCTAAELVVELSSRACKTGAKSSSSARRFSFGTRCSQKAIASPLYLRRISVFTPTSTFHRNS